MSKPVPTTWIAIAMVVICYLMAGVLVKSSGSVIGHFFAESSSAEIPKITMLFMRLSGWVGTVPLMIVLGILAGAGLGFVARREHLQPHLPIAFTMAWTLVLMIVVSAYFAVFLPLLFVVHNAAQ